MQDGRKPKDTDNNPGDSTSREQRGSADPGARSAPSGSEVRSPKINAKGGQSSDQQKHWLDYATGFFAFIAAIGAITAAGFTAKQAWVASDIEHRQLQAYVGPVVDSFIFSCPACQAYVANPKAEIKPSLGDGVTLKIKNYGLTPARRIYACGTLMPVSEKESPVAKRNELFRYCDSRSEKLIGPTIWPQEERSQTIPFDPMILPGIVSIFQTKEVRGFLLAGIVYEDVFDVPHKTFITRLFVPSTKLGNSIDFGQYEFVGYTMINAEQDY